MATSNELSLKTAEGYTIYANTEVTLAARYAHYLHESVWTHASIIDQGRYTEAALTAIQDLPVELVEENGQLLNQRIVPSITAEKDETTK